MFFEQHQGLQVVSCISCTVGLSLGPGSDERFTKLMVKVLKIYS